MEKINIAVVGCGIIGGALISWCEEHNPNVNILKIDPPKGYNDNIQDADIIFISIHIPTEEDGSGIVRRSYSFGKGACRAQ